MVIQFKLSKKLVISAKHQLTQTFWINDYLLFCLVHKFRNPWCKSERKRERIKNIYIERKREIGRGVHA